MKSNSFYSFPPVIEPLKHKSVMRPQSEEAEDIWTTSFN